MYSSKASNSVYVKSVDSNNYINDCMNSELDSCFNPTIYFACKFCRQSTRNVGELLLHKRLKHTAQELSGIKCIIFEETFGKPEYEFDGPDQLLPFSSESEDFIRENTLISNSTKKSNHIECQDDRDRDQYNIVNVNNTDNHETVSNSYQSKESNLPNPYVLLERLTSTEINSLSNIIRISEGINHSTKISRSCKQNSTASHLTDVQIPCSIHNGEIVHFIGTKRNSRSVFPTEHDNIIEISNSKRCKIIETDDELIRNEIESGDVVNNSSTNDKWTGDHSNENEISQRESSNTILSRVLSGEPVDLNPTCSNDFNITDNGISGGDDLIEDTQELEHGEFIVAHIIKDCDGTEKVEFISTDSPAIEAGSSVSAVKSTGYDYAVNPVPHVINEFHGIDTHEDLRDIKSPSRSITELGKRTLIEKENLPYDDLFDSADCHEDSIQDNESDLLTPIYENYSTEPPISEPILIGNGENSSQTEGFNLYTQNTIRELFTENEADLDQKLVEADALVTTTNLTSVFVPEPILTQGGGANNFNESGLNKHPCSNICTSILDADLSTSVDHIKSKPHQENRKDEEPLTIQSAPRYNTRTRRNPSKISYSENQSCLMCNKDFYTIEDLENHEKKCALLRSDGTISLNAKGVSQKNSGFPSFEDKGASESDDIHIIKLKSQKVNPVQDPVNDYDYNGEASNSNNSSDSEIDDQNDVVIDDTLTADCNYLQRTNKSAKRPKLNKAHLPSPPVSLTEADLQLPLVTWLQNEKSSYNNVILLDPDPTKLTGQKFAASTNSDAKILKPAEKNFESLLYPITCKLCSLNLNSDTDVKNHVRFCWTFNKPNHLYCIRCRLSFAFQHSYNRHIEFKHRRHETQENQINESDGPNCGSESGAIDDVDSSSCCESVSDGESESKPMYDEEPVFFRDLKHLSFTEWLKKQAQENPENIFRLDPDPLHPGSGSSSGPGPSRNTSANAADFTISPQNPIKCNLCCSPNFISDFDARSHIETCWRYNKKAHTYCIKCEKSYSSHRYLQQHNKAKHPKPGDALPVPTKSVKCDVCNKEFSTQSTLNFHKKNHSFSKTPVLKNFICEICGSAFRQSSALQAHKSSHFKDRSFKCTLCPKTYKTKRELKNHNNIHSEKIKCTLCVKSFPTNSCLKIHMRTHTGELAFPCTTPDCNLKFATKYSLEAHCTKAHEEMGFKKFACTVCSKSYLGKQRLTLHMLTHCGKKFKCMENGCTRAFISKDLLQEHLRSHTGETPFQCETCGKAYSRLGSFQKHIRVHTDSHNKFSCDKCPRKFPGSWELKQHLIIHEKGKQFKCDQCGFKCMTKATLKGHLKVHEAAPWKGGRKNNKSESEKSETEIDKKNENESDEEVEVKDDTESDSDSGSDASPDPETEK